MRVYKVTKVRYGVQLSSTCSNECEFANDIPPNQPNALI